MNHGLALCCNQTPIYGHGEGISSHFKCPVCDQKVGGWSRNIEWIASLWNQKQGKAFISKDLNIETGSFNHVYEPNMKLDVDGWRYAKLGYSHWLPYHKEELIEKDFILFQVDRTDYELLHTKEGWECIIDDSRCFKKFKLRSYLGKEVELDLPSFKKKHNDPFQVYVNHSWSTDGSCWYRLNITAYNRKWCDYFDGVMKELFN
jgi:hypothetical protein